MMTDLSFFQDTLVMIKGQFWATKLLFILGLYAIAPVCGAPITLLSYATGCIFGLFNGVCVGMLGLILNITLLLEGAFAFSHKSVFQKKIHRLKKRFPKFDTELSFPAVVGLASLMPYLPLVILLGLTQTDKRKTYAGLVLGSMPAFIIALQAGAIGNSLLLGLSPQRIFFSLATLALALMIHIWIFKKAKRTLLAK